MSTTDDLRAIRNRIGVDDALRDTLDVLIAANDTGVSRRDADDGAGKGSTARLLPPLAGADASDVSMEGRSENGAQKGAQSLGDDLRAMARGEHPDQSCRPHPKFTEAFLEYADRADALEAEREAECRSAGAWRQDAQEAQDELFRIHDILELKGTDDLAGAVQSKLDALTTERDTWKRRADTETRLVDSTQAALVKVRAERDELRAERDEARTEAESLRRAAQVTTTSWREHVERADKAEAAVARVRALLDRPLIPSALLRDALDGVDAGGEA